MRFLKAGSSVDLVLLAVLDHQLAVDDAVEQRREHRLQRHGAVLRRQRLLGDLELRQLDRLAVDRGDHRILERLGGRRGGCRGRLGRRLLARRLGGLAPAAGGRRRGWAAGRRAGPAIAAAAQHRTIRRRGRKQWLMTGSGTLDEMGDEGGALGLHRPARAKQALPPRQRRDGSGLRHFFVRRLGSAVAVRRSVSRMARFAAARVDTAGRALYLWLGRRAAVPA